MGEGRGEGGEFKYLWKVPDREGIVPRSPISEVCYNKCKQGK